MSFGRYGFEDSSVCVFCLEVAEPIVATTPEGQPVESTCQWIGGVCGECLRVLGPPASAPAAGGE